MRRFRNASFLPLILLGLISFLILFYLTLPSPKKSEYPISPSILKELSTEGYTKVSVDAQVVGNNGIVRLRGGCYQLIAYTEPTQAYSIMKGLEGKIDFRPNTHDLIKSIFDELGIKVLLVKIVDLRNNTFIGEMIIQQGNKIINLDSRPSDATAIAVRYGIPIYIKTKLLKENGEYIC